MKLSQNTFGILELLYADERRTDMAKLRKAFLQTFVANAPYAMKHHAHYLHRMIQYCHYIYVLKSDECDFIHILHFYLSDTVR
jgi:DICT domain-containing protein